MNSINMDISYIFSFIEIAFGIVFVVTTVTIVTGGIIYAIIYNNKQLKDIEILKKQTSEYCLKNGFEYNDIQRGFNDRFIAIKDSFLIKKGESGKIFCEMYINNDEIETSVFNYYYIVDDGESKTKRYDAFCILNKKGLFLPEFYLYKKNNNAFLDGLINLEFKVMNAGGRIINLLFPDSAQMKLIKFDNDPAFSNQFSLYGRDEREVKNLFSSKVRKAFIKNYYQNCTYHVFNNYLIVDKVYSLLNHEERINMLEYSKNLFNSFMEN